MPIFKIGDDYADVDFAFLGRHLNALDLELRETLAAISRSADPDSDGLLDAGEYFIGHGFIAIQRYMTTVIVAAKMPRKSALNLGPKLANGTTCADALEAGANYWKHVEEWFGKTPHARTLAAIEKVTPWAEYTCSNILAVLRGGAGLELSPLLLLLAAWRDRVMAAPPTDAMPATKVPYGNRQARALCNMPHEARLDFVAEGLPIVLASAQGFWNAAGALAGNNPREAVVLEGFAEEEAAKALILIDLVRCPPKEANNRVGRIISKMFYDHLARMIYAKAQAWRPVHVTMLQEYVDQERKAHYLEGYASEYIVPNWALYARESAMYADIEEHENGGPYWNDPRHFGSPSGFRPPALDLIEALSAIGVFTPAGVRAVSEIWGTVDFQDSEGPEIARELTGALGARLHAEGLVTEAATDSHARSFHHHWQMPMYNLEFSLLPVSMEELNADRDAALWQEIGS
jgi:hypothetical protein